MWWTCDTKCELEKDTAEKVRKRLKKVERRQCLQEQKTEHRKSKFYAHQNIEEAVFFLSSFLGVANRGGEE